MIKRLFFLLVGLAAFIRISSAQAVTQQAQSPNGAIQGSLVLTEKGEPGFKVRYKGVEIIPFSKLGMALQGHDLSKNLTLIGKGTASQKGVWRPVWGEVDEITDHYNAIQLELKSKSGIRMNVVMRVYDEGIGFRYEFPSDENPPQIMIEKELTEFQLTEDYKVWWAPSDWDSNEHTYKNTPLTQIDATSYLGDIEPFNQRIFNVHAVQTPVTMQSATGYCMAIAEAGLIDYGALHLELDRDAKRFSARIIPTTDANVISKNKTPFHTPWRAVLINSSAAGLLTNRLILNLNEPCKIEGDLSWIKPQKYVGIWWEMHVGKSGWNYRDLAAKKLSTNHGATTENVKKHIDFAAKHGFGGVLVEGWNEGWDEWFNVNKPEVFDFTKPYPDYNMPEISRYAKEKGVKIIVHNETAAAVESYERQIPAAYDYIRQNGFNAIKTGYVGYVLPKGEWHDGQYMINHFNRVLEKAAEKQIMVVAHEPVRPSGLHRTWPNFMAAEAARGMEFNAWSKGNDPSHELTLIFTRLLGGPMDYTPGIFQVELNQFDPNKKDRVRTTVAKQLALYVDLYSPVQMAADLLENYEKRPDVFQFIKDVPTDWSETRVLNAAIGDYVTIARREKNSDNWFVGSMTDETPRQFKIKLDFLEPKRTYEVTIYEDGPKAHYLDNPYPVNIRKVKVKKGQTLKINLAAGGGWAAKFDR
ncbi:MAG: glycoside hydrolase family 97 protein [Saprospiraceae bacterium]|nr:glycoside hydrolase family 97 protein [Saprospiraceae bacterium]